MWKWSGQSDEMQISGPVLKSVTNIESLSMQQTMDMWDAAEKGELEVLKILFKKKTGPFKCTRCLGQNTITLDLFMWPFCSDRISITK